MPLLMEQLWYESQYNSIGIVEIYDIVVLNESTDTEVDEFVILYPHDLTGLTTDDPLPVNILQVDPDHKSQYDWYFATRPVWANEQEGRVSLSIPARDSNLVVQGQAESITCQRLFGEVIWPDQIASKGARFAVMKKLGRSLFKIKLSNPLKAGDTGVIRLRIAPDYEKMKKVQAIIQHTDSSGGPPSRFSWDIRIDSPMFVREHTKGALQTLSGQAKSEVDHGAVEEVRKIFQEIIRDDSKASVRVIRHWLAIFGDNSMTIDEVTRSDGMVSIGSLPVQGRRAVNWVGGSAVNLNRDLVHNVHRIRDFLLNRNNRSDEQQLNELTETDGHEAFFTLVNELLKVGLLGNSR